ncbi:MAG: YdcF family protein [Caulobacteraceae bacterium]|nr:YdcF family protein [Caulobacter sp.]RYF91587.1 MAG: YdcF family protein [Caulobacteraceae bacterium]
MRRLSLLLILIVVWFVGLLAFAGRIDKLTPAAEPPVSDAVAVLTGASTERIKVAVRLLEEGKGKRLLVSGVNTEVTREDLLEVTGAWKPIYQCCVDLGFEAADTKGNAQEIAAWAEKHSFRQVIVVTADYHMPRSMLELRGQMPGARLIAYPVKTDAMDTSRWWRDQTQIRRLTLEYCKYLAVLVQESVMGFVRKAPDAQAERPEKTK